MSILTSADADLHWMHEALKLARRAGQRGEVPIGAVMVQNGQILSSAFNQREMLHSSLGHAECLAIHRANQKLKAWRLLNTTLYVTLEPCLMCAGAILQSRVPRLVFGAFDPKAGAVSTLYRVLDDSRLNHRTEVTSGILGEECGALLRDFFRERRKAKE